MATKKKNATSAAAALLGSKGGKAKHTKPRGFAAMPKWKRQAAGSKGGSAPRTPLPEKTT